ncbi:type 1 glutamine amidotransferase [uncultured Litoreibacter sp.]|uniref:type 1 glutamine amidotransferase n=1 Tax=uncultured Litoreibacter sp. TaxID=1392394 RepID=UPI002603E818|nr:type 1 glutamine amidotransferase [uncultured Litoreibacter sp.]
MKIGILECGHTMSEVKSKHGTFPQMFERLLRHGNFTFASYDVEFMQFPQSVEECDGWLLTGSKHGAYEDHPFIPPLEEFIRTAYARAVPMVGICFGHQIIAQALGGHVEKFKGGWALGLNDYTFDDIGTVQLNAWHQDQVITRPSGATPVASNAFCENAALLYGDRAFSVQPHPEFGGAIIADYAKLRKGTADYPDALMDRAAAQAELPDDNDALAAKIAAFFHQPREAAHA